MSPSLLLSELAENTNHAKINLPAVVFLLFCLPLTGSNSSSHRHIKSHDSRPMRLNMIACTSLLMIPKHVCLLRNLQTDTPH